MVRRTMIGYLPDIDDLNLAGADVKSDAIQELTSVNTAAWQREVEDFRRYLGEFGDRMPREILAQLEQVARAAGQGLTPATRTPVGQRA